MRRLSLVIGFLFLATFICWFFSGSARAQRPRVKPVGRVTVVDSKGKTVGTLLGGLGMAFVHAGHNIAFTPTVLLDVQGRLVPLDVAREGFYTDSILYYESTDCAGKPWIQEARVQFQPPFQGLLPSVGIGLPGHTAYGPVNGSESQLITVRSASILDRCGAFFAQVRVVPTEALIDLDTEFTPPFELRAGS